MPSIPEVSICIASYNHARYLPSAIESALSQTYRNIEIIIVDDGSTDDSLAIAESYSHRYPALVKVFTHPDGGNHGIAATSNLAFRKSTGHYWSGLGSDDEFYPQKTERQLNYLKQHPDLGWIYGHAHVIDEEGQLLPDLFGIDISAAKHQVENLLTSNPIPAMTVMARRECFEAIGRESEHLIYSDWEFWIRLAAHYRVGFLAEPLVKYRIHGYNTSIGVDLQEDLKRGLAVLESVAQRAESYGGSLTEPSSQLFLQLQLARYQFCLGERAAASEGVRFAFECCPEARKNLEMIDDWWIALHPVPEGLPEFSDWMLQQLRTLLRAPFSRSMTKRLKGLTFANRALHSYWAGDLVSARRLVLQAQKTDPRWLYNRELLSILVETIVGSRVMRRARQVKGSVTTHSPSLS